jgi:hypothetical protein
MTFPLLKQRLVFLKKLVPQSCRSVARYAIQCSEETNQPMSGWRSHSDAVIEERGDSQDEHPEQRHGDPPRTTDHDTDSILCAASPAVSRISLPLF